MTVREASLREDRPDEGTSFLWGAATSAYQVEGAVREDGRGASIWDRFCRKPGAILGRGHRRHRVRSLPPVRGRHRPDGRAGDRCVPVLDRLAPDLPRGRRSREPAGPRSLPPASSRRSIGTGSRRSRPCTTGTSRRRSRTLGGWANRDTASRFAEYAAIVHGALGGEIPTWITINEPWVAAWLGYGTGVHAPGKADDALALAASHHLLLAHGLAVEAMDGDGRGRDHVEPPADDARLGRRGRRPGRSARGPPT